MISRNLHKNAVQRLFALSTVLFYVVSIAGAAGSPVLKMGVGARAAALGSAYTAVANDVTSLHWNPAGLSVLHKKELVASHGELFAATRQSFLGYAQPVGGFALGAGALYLGHEAIEGRAPDRSVSGDFGARDMLLTLGGSRKMGSAVALGLNAKVLRSEIASTRATAWAFDLGARWQSAGGKVISGAALKNIGPQIRYLSQRQDLPATLSGGLGYQTGFILLSGDLSHSLYDSNTSLNLGVEFTPARFIALRSGYVIAGTPGRMEAVGGPSTGNARRADLSGLGAGLGLKLGSATLDYAFSPAGELGNTQTLTLAIRY